MCPHPHSGLSSLNVLARKSIYGKKVPRCGEVVQKVIQWMTGNGTSEPRLEAFPFYSVEAGELGRTYSSRMPEHSRRILSL